MKKLIVLITAAAALISFAAFAFYFFKLNPDFCPCKKSSYCETEE